MNITEDFRDTLKKIGPGRITESAYDMAWVARLAEYDEQIGKQALSWLRESQLPDGSWGTPDFVYHHERLVCTLAAATTLARHADVRDRPRLERAVSAIEQHAPLLGNDPAKETIGFEMIVPTLVDEAHRLGLLTNTNGYFNALLAKRTRKLAELPEGMINRYVTVAFSAEMLPEPAISLLDLDNLLETNGSVACSPAATTWYYMNIDKSSSALEFLYRVDIDGEGKVPYIAPVDIFEVAWSLWNLALSGLPFHDSAVMELCEPHLDFLEQEWGEQGVASVSPLSLPDADTSSVTSEVLARFGRTVDTARILQYEEDTHFRCFGLEANPSISTNIHVMSTLRQAGYSLDHPSIVKVRRFLFEQRINDMFWFDKWHASPIYPSAHAVIAAAGYDDELVKNTAQWLIDTQARDGSWGYYVPTAEETAYSLQALVVWKRAGGLVPIATLQRGRDWLQEHLEPPYPYLWIGKSLYHLEYVNRTAALSALALVGQEL